MSIERDIMKVLAASLFLLMGCERAASKKDDPVLRECLQYLSDSGVDLNSDDFSWYADFCKVVRNYTHEKLTVYEIMAATDKLSDVLAMKPLPGFGIVIDPEKRMIRGQISAMEFLPMTKDKKLTYAEKEAFATCVYWGYCGRNVDSRTGKEVPAFEDFKNPGKIKDVYARLKEDLGTRGAYLRHDPGSSGKFGIEISNPIRATSVAASYKYLSRMYPNSRSMLFKYDRIGSMSGVNDNIIDAYAFKLKDTNNKTNYTFTVYIDPYCDETSTRAIDGWILADEDYAFRVGCDAWKRFYPHISDGLKPADELKFYYNEEFPLSGGWGYGIEGATEIVGEFASSNDVCKIVNDFIEKRTYLELIILPRDMGQDMFVGITRECLNSSMRESDGWNWLIYEYVVSAYLKDEWESLKEDWESHGAYSNDEEGKKKHIALANSKLVAYKTYYVFKYRGKKIAK